MKKTRIKILIFLLAAIGFVCMLFPLFHNSAAPQSLGSVRLNIETYRAGKNQPTHPSVVVFPEQWNGAKYWLAYSPYPYANGEEENPCIAISDDLLYWQSPAGLANPIADNEETGCDELKDPHLLYRNDLDRLEMWYLGRLSENQGGDGTTLLLMRKYSDDGTNWSSYEVMSPTKYLSPSIVWDGTKYQMWAIGYDLWNTTGTIVYQESPDGRDWTEPVKCYLGEKQSDIDIWHGSVTKYNDGYHMSFIDNSDKQEVFYCTSNDGIHFDAPVTIISNDGYWKNLYRPFLWFDEEGCTCIYGVVNTANQWYLSMSSGKTADSLCGVTSADSSKISPLADDMADTHSITFKLGQLYDMMKNCLRIELYVLAAIEIMMMVFVPKLWSSRNYFILCLIGNLLISVFWIIIRMQLFRSYYLAAGIISILILNCSITAIVRCAQFYHSKNVS